MNSYEERRNGINGQDQHRNNYESRENNGNSYRRNERDGRNNNGYNYNRRGGNYGEGNIKGVRNLEERQDK